MIVAEMRAAHVPVEILGLDVQGEYVGDDGVHRRRDVLGRGARHVGAGGHRSFAALFEVSGFLRCEGGHGFPSIGLCMGPLSAGACSLPGSAVVWHTWCYELV